MKRWKERQSQNRALDHMVTRQGKQFLRVHGSLNIGDARTEDRDGGRYILPSIELYGTEVWVCMKDRDSETKVEKSRKTKTEVYIGRDR